MSKYLKGMTEKAKVDLDKKLASSAGKDYTCNAGDPGSIPGSGRSPGEGIGYLLQYSWASLVAQLVKSLPAVQGTWVRSSGWEDPLVKGMATHSIIQAWRILWTKEPGGLQSMEFPRQESGVGSLSLLQGIFPTQG